MSVDIAFAKAKPPGGRRLNFHQFLRALALLSEEARQDLFYSIPTLGCYLPLPWPTPTYTHVLSRPCCLLHLLPYHTHTHTHIIQRYTNLPNW